MNRYLLVTALALLTVSTGCKTPSVTFKSALLKKLTTNHLDVGLNLDVLNPNEYEIPINGLDWSLDLFSSKFNDGAVQLSRNIGPAQTTAVAVPIGMSYNAIAVGVQNVLVKRDIPWGLGGGVSFNIAGQPLRVAYASDGKWRNPLFK
jgi:LEA14-like dessication related protein